MALAYWSTPSPQGGYSSNSGGGSGTGFPALSDSASLDNTGNGLFAIGANNVSVVTNSMLAGNSLADLRQGSSSELRTSGNNALTGRGAGDVTGTLTANPLK